MTKHIIYLTGFMGAGKTTVGEALAQQVGWKWTDLDRAIEQRENCSIADLFAQKGEVYFRKVETEMLQVCGQGEQLILSCGGGSILREENRSYMKQTGIVVYLRAKPENLAERVKETNNRPLLLEKDNADIVEKIAMMLEERKQYYEEVADVIIDTDEKEIEQIVDELKKQFLP